MTTATALLDAPDLFFAELTCRPDDPEWGEENLVTRHIVALPSTPVWQYHDGAERQLLNQNNVVLHHAGSEYRRERFRDGGYRCLFLVPTPVLMREVAAGEDPSIADSQEVRFPASVAPLDGPTFALSRLAARCLRPGGPAGGAGAREALYEVLRRVVRASGVSASKRSAVSPATARARREIVEEAKEMLNGAPVGRVPLDDLARSLFTSPYHLARIFRAATGFSIHGYATHLRLRTGFDRIQASADRIGDVGAALGYHSHSHFTSAFRRAFGMTPSVLANADLALHRARFR
jgi:AraC family transcriptional regulator